MARYRLRSDHVIGGQVVPAGTEVGTDTDIPFDQVPSNQMEGLDDEGVAKVNELHQQLYGTDAPWHSEAATETREADEKAYKEQQEEERKSGQNAAVSAQPMNQRLGTANVAPTRGGQAAGPGVATPKSEPIRPTKPNEEQSPKD